MAYRKRKRQPDRDPATNHVMIICSYLLALADLPSLVNRRFVVLDNQFRGGLFRVHVVIRGIVQILNGYTNFDNYLHEYYQN